MKIKYYIPTSLRHTIEHIALPMLFIGLILLVLASSVHGMNPASEYGDNQCELIAKDVQKEYGGSLVWIQPLKDNGAYDFGDYNAHIINKVYLSGVGVVYWDYQSGANMTSIDEVRTWYEWYSGGKNSEVYDLEFERPSWGMKWYY